MKTIKILFAVIAVLAFTACYNDNLSELTIGAGDGVTTCNSDGVMSFGTDINPILQNYCGSLNSCHNSTNSSGVNLSTYTGVKAVVLNGKLISSITWTGSASHMPKNGSKLSDCTIAKIQKWVDAGSPNN